MLKSWNNYRQIGYFLENNANVSKNIDPAAQQLINTFIGNKNILKGESDASTYFSPSQPEYYFNYPNTILLTTLAAFQQSGASYEVRNNLQKAEKLFSQGLELYDNNEILAKIRHNQSFTQQILLLVYQ